MFNRNAPGPQLRPFREQYTDLICDSKAILGMQSP